MNTISIICQVLGIALGLIIIGLLANVILEARREKTSNKYEKYNKAIEEFKKGRKKDDGD